MTSDDKLKKFEEYFDLPSNKNDDSEQAEEYGHSAESEDSFDELIQGVTEDTQKMDDKGTVVDKPREGDDIVDEEFSTDTKEVEEKENLEVILTEKCDELAEEVECKDDKIQWLFESPSDMYDSFYRAKRELLSKYMVGGQVKYTMWINELAEARVDIRSEVFDQDITLVQMEQVQQHRERVKYISVRVNNQYFMMKRYIDLMRGFLARIQYLKPALKQEGLIHEHMRDIELYYARLEALHDSAVKTEKTLAAAFDTLSRRVSICMELRPTIRYRKDVYSSSDDRASQPEQVPNKAEGNSDDLKDFDDLPTGATAGPQKRKVGSIEWNEI